MIKSIYAIIDNVEVNPILTMTEYKFIKDTLVIDDLTDNHLFVLRNEVVRYLSGQKHKARFELENWEKFDMYDNAMSKIVSVIDKEKFERNMPV